MGEYQGTDSMMTSCCVNKLANPPQISNVEQSRPTDIVNVGWQSHDIVEVNTQITYHFWWFYWSKHPDYVSLLMVVLLISQL